VYDALEEFRDRMKVRARDKMTQMTMRQAVMLLCPPYNLTREAYQGMRGLFPGLFPPLWRLDVERAGCKTVLEDIPGVQDGAMVKHPMAMIICDMKDYKDGINRRTCTQRMLAAGVVAKLDVDLPLEEMGVGGLWTANAAMGEEEWLVASYLKDPTGGSGVTNNATNKVGRCKWNTVKTRVEGAHGFSA
jgi:hypothetical protein